MDDDLARSTVSSALQQGNNSDGKFVPFTQAMLAVVEKLGITLEKLDSFFDDHGSEQNDATLIRKMHEFINNAELKTIADFYQLITTSNAGLVMYRTVNPTQTNRKAWKQLIRKAREEAKKTRSIDMTDEDWDDTDEGI